MHGIALRPRKPYKKREEGFEMNISLPTVLILLVAVDSEETVAASAGVVYEHHCETLMGWRASM